MTALNRLKPSVLAVITSDFLAGGQTPDLTPYAEPTEEEFDGEALRALFDAAKALEKSASETDAWLAPRFHYLLRISRRTAGDRGVWAWLAMTICRPYVTWRFAPEGNMKAWRYYGDHLRNAVSRLWWGAEMVRNGPSYEHVPLVFSRVRTAQFALELSYSRYRPAAIAFTRVAEGLSGDRRLTDDEMKDLSKSINAYLSLTALEAMGLNEDETGVTDEDWRRHCPPLSEFQYTEVATLQGPNDGVASEEAIRHLEEWFRNIALTSGASA
jgi:Family of unknown function (DUF6339)